MDHLPPPPASADFLQPSREHNRDGNRFTVAQMEYNVRLTRSKQLAELERRTTGTPARDGFAKMFQLLSK